MTTYPETLTLSEPVGSERVPAGNLEYFRARHRHRVYDMIVDELLASGISKADLAKRLGASPARISRVLGAPSNLTLDTLSDLLFATSGAEPTYAIAYPLSAPTRNYAHPEWLDSPTLRTSLANQSSRNSFQAEMPTSKAKKGDGAGPMSARGVMSVLASARQ